MPSEDGKKGGMINVDLQHLSHGMHTHHGNTICVHGDGLVNVQLNKYINVKILKIPV